MKELKPCPFCGEQPKVGHYETFDNDEWYIGCDCECEPCTKTHLTYEQAIEAWNTRVDRTCRNTRVDRTCRNENDKWSRFAKYLFVCSECGWNLADVGNTAIDISAGIMRFCPFCGAKVVGE